MHCANPGRAEAATSARDQTTKASSSNATATRRFTGASTASSECPRRTFCTNACPAITILALAVLVEPAHRLQPRLQPTMVGLDPVVGIAVGSMPGRREQLLEHCRVHLRMVGDHLDWRDPHRADGALEDPAGGLGVPACRDEHVDDLPNWSIAR